jgi:hypothetical protein
MLNTEFANSNDRYSHNVFSKWSKNNINIGSFVQNKTHRAVDRELARFYIDSLIILKTALNA